MQAERAKLEADKVALEEAKRKFEADAKSVTEAYAKKKAELAQVHQKLQLAKQKFVSEKEEFEKIKKDFLADPNAKKFFEERSKGTDSGKANNNAEELKKIQEEKLKLQEERKAIAEQKKKLEKEQQELAKFNEEKKKFAEEVKKYEQAKQQLIEERKAFEKSRQLNNKRPEPQSSPNLGAPPPNTPAPAWLTAANSPQRSWQEKRASRRSLYNLGLTDSPDGRRQSRPSSMNLANWRRSVTEKHLRVHNRTDSQPDSIKELHKQVTTYDQLKKLSESADPSSKAKSSKPESKQKGVRLSSKKRKDSKPSTPTPTIAISSKSKGKDEQDVLLLTEKKFVRPTVIPEGFKLPPARPVYELKKENLPYVPPKLSEFGDVISNLNLSQNYLTSIPDEIGNLSNLVELDISHNHIKKIPSALIKCTKLQTLLFGGNPEISLPSNFPSMLNLTTVSVQRNGLTTVPEEICQLPKLEHLDISFNKIAKLPASMKALSGLLTLVAGPNLLTELPREIGDLASLTYLDLKQNKLARLPPEIGQLSQLEELYLSDNKLTALPFQMKLSNMSALFKIDAFRNEITEIPDSFFEGGPESALEEIHFGRNKISSLPPGLWEMNQVVVLDFRNNDLTHIPPQIGNLFQVAILDLGHNKIREVPREIASCANLATLNLFGNQLKSLPDEFRHVNRLRQLYLGYNQLTEFSFLEDTYFEDLEELFLNGNPITKIPSQISDNAPILRYLYLNNMNLTEIPSEIGYLGYLEQLDLSHNNLTTLPVEILQLRQLYSLDVSHNKLVNTENGDAEDGHEWDTANWATELSGIEIIDLSNNSLVRLPNGVETLATRGIQVLSFSNPFSASTNRLRNSPFGVGWSEMVGRRPAQEDSLCIAGQIGDPKWNMYLYALFDGHAGRGAADFSAKNFEKHLLQRLQSPSCKNDPLKALMEAFLSVNEGFRKFGMGSKDPAVKHCGTTGVAALIVGKTLFVANVGDARAVMYKGGDSNKPSSTEPRAINLCSSANVVRVSEDHKPDEEEERIRAAGGYVVESRVNGFLGVSRSIGDYYIDAVVCVPSGSKHQLPTHQDAFIILGCDGVWDELSDEEACSVIHHYKDKSDPHKLCGNLRDYAYFFGSDDNISTMLIQLKK